MDMERLCGQSHGVARSTIPEIGRLEQALHDTVDRIRDSERMIEQSRALLKWFSKHVR
jgi:hypothetical protein